MKTRLDMAKIAKGLRAVRRGKVHAKGGHLGALGLVAEVEARFCVPEGGGRATTEQLSDEDAEGLLRRRRAG